MSGVITPSWRFPISFNKNCQSKSYRPKQFSLKFKQLSWQTNIWAALKNLEKQSPAIEIEEIKISLVETRKTGWSTGKNNRFKFFLPVDLIWSRHCMTATCFDQIHGQGDQPVFTPFSRSVSKKFGLTECHFDRNRFILSAFGLKNSNRSVLI